MRKPDYADTRCPKCLGHGGWNIVLNAGGPMRNLTQDCERCNGDGWIETDGEEHVPDIILRDGKPAWVTAIYHRPRG